jgi:hypothetical protein
MLRPFRDTHLAEEYRCCASTRSADGDLGQARASESGFKLDETRPKTNAQEVVMSKWRSLAALLVAGFFISFGATYSRDRADAQSDQALRIDILVKLEKANVVFDIGHLVLNGDMPFFLGDMDLLASDLSSRNVKGEIIAVFHGDAAYLVLNDNSYNANRNIHTGHLVRTGNPYGKLLAGLMEQVYKSSCAAPPPQLTLDQSRPPSGREGRHQCNGPE